MILIHILKVGGEINKEYDDKSKSESKNVRDCDIENVDYINVRVSVRYKTIKSGYIIRKSKDSECRE